MTAVNQADSLPGAWSKGLMRCNYNECRYSMYLILVCVHHLYFEYGYSININYTFKVYLYSIFKSFLDVGSFFAILIVFPCDFLVSF